MQRDMQKEALIKEFKECLQKLGYSKTTVNMLPACAREFLEAQKIINLEVMQPYHILAHHEYLKERPHKRKAGGLSEQHISHHLYSLKVFFAWLEQTCQITENPISSLSFATPRQKQRETLSREEIQQLYEVAENYQEKALLSLFYGCGLRRAEAEKLKVKDVHFRSSLLYVREGKGAKRRVVPMSEKVRQDLQNYLYQERYALPAETAFLCNTRGRRMRGASCMRILKQLLERAAIKREPIQLHSLRHSIATHLLAAGLPVEQVREFLGHQHLESTQIYTKVSKEQLWNL